MKCCFQRSLVCLALAAAALHSGAARAEYPVSEASATLRYAEGDGEGDTAAEPADEPAFEVGDTEVEVIKTRYPNRNVKIERHVTQDSERNYINHGGWTMWDPDGVMLGKGAYRYGKLHGKWRRWFVDAEATQFTGRLYEGFEKPFSAEATFVEGQLQGAWEMFDAKGRKISSWQFDKDELHGSVVWWHPGGRKSREETYNHGILDGDVLKWEADGALISKTTYREGQKHGRYVKTFPTGDKQVEGFHLYANKMTQTSYDWWNGTITVEPVGDDGDKVRVGKWTYWHANGGKQFEGEFLADQPIGRHTWWFPNGQIRLTGNFVDGKQNGKWSWWFSNGQKHIEGEYRSGVQAGSWVKWSESGRVAEVQEEPAAAKLARVDKKPKPQLPQDVAARLEQLEVSASDVPDAQADARPIETPVYSRPRSIMVEPAAATEESPANYDNSSGSIPDDGSLPTMSPARLR